jgi:hypothetical protein
MQVTHPVTQNNTRSNEEQRDGITSPARGAADRIEPVVERSGTPGTVDENIQSPRSGRESNHSDEAVVVIATSVARSAGCGGFWVDDPGVALRFTPGFMLPSAPRTKIPSQSCPGV